ncbi:SOS response-associated peptidase family protein [Floccifex sp.]|uniref:SOS response-associated peptidase family protein n=1 Tax=Floccifex sp. TaxID=2815810 RepID=UPI003F0F7C55
MCGRYYIDLYTLSKFTKETIKTGDIYPGQEALVLVGNEKMLPKKMKWGIQFQNHQIINARIEKKYSLPRCVIPASSFYEWDDNQIKVTFYKENQILYFAGHYQNNHFVIVTTKANESMKEVHPRMPLILKKDEVKEYLKGKSFENYIPEELSSSQAIKQLSLF